MSGSHLHRLYVTADSPVHRLAAQVKLLALVLFVVAVVATPRRQVWAFAADAVLLATLAGVARLPGGLVLRRLLVELPFVLFAVLLPFVVPGERVHVAGLALSVEGLWGAWNVLAKATLGTAAAVLLAATTAPRELLVGAQRLRLPSVLLQILTFMLRYLDVVADQMTRMRIARDSRAFRARDLRQLGAVASSAGALFVRTYERGERVHLAMLSRAYAGRMPLLDSATVPARAWLGAAALPAAAAGLAALAWWVQP